MTKPACDAVVVGAGQAGLGVSYFLKQAGLAHRVLERGQIGETWRTQRWKSFVLNSTNAVSVLPGDSYGGSSPEGFHSLNDTITLFSDYAQHHQLPVETGVCVNRLESAVHRQGYLVSSDTETIFAANVVIATGSTNRPRIPAMSSRLPQHLQ